MNVLDFRLNSKEKNISNEKSEEDEKNNKKNNNAVLLKEKIADIGNQSEEVLKNSLNMDFIENNYVILSNENLKSITNNAQDFLNADNENKKNLVDNRPVDVQMHEIDDILGFFIFIFITIYYYYFLLLLLLLLLL
jgi:hypothetical protein